MIAVHHHPIDVSSSAANLCVGTVMRRLEPPPAWLFFWPWGRWGFFAQKKQGEFHVKNGDFTSKHGELTSKNNDFTSKKWFLHQQKWMNIQPPGFHRSELGDILVVQNMSTKVVNM
jgi:hypothetical protein